MTLTNNPCGQRREKKETNTMVDKIKSTRRSNKTMRRKTAIAFSLILALSAVAPKTTAVTQQGPPTDVVESFPIEGICAFPVLVELNGKAKSIELPGGSTLFTSPQLTATFTNLNNPLRRETLGITGAIREAVLENGDVELVFTGRNLIIGLDPTADFVVTIGRFSVAFDEDFNITQPLSGEGQMINVCQLLQ
jgi:hypothetical protein